ncbi:unnamed protein product [Ceratitis capitata]|uniref:(Mediterranean fruit fly) hypothetical protein n=1 Tax=Ceratitis capitata TaxID=7213 RepID=A0A811U6L6_CERCA|nr:unnamed protein product [Ceratitis capitata]
MPMRHERRLHESNAAAQTNQPNEPGARLNTRTHLRGSVTLCTMTGWTLAVGSWQLAVVLSHLGRGGAAIKSHHQQPNNNLPTQSNQPTDQATATRVFVTRIQL